MNSILGWDVSLKNKGYELTNLSVHGNTAQFSARSVTCNLSQQERPDGSV